MEADRTAIGGLSKTLTGTRIQRNLYHQRFSYRRGAEKVVIADGLEFRRNPTKNGGIWGKHFEQPKKGSKMDFNFLKPQSKHTKGDIKTAKSLYIKAINIGFHHEIILKPE